MEISIINSHSDKFKMPEQNNAKKKQDYVQIRVSDTGCGIPSALLTKIFNRYYQVNDTQTNKEGTGLGLALVKELVELHHGRITVESKINKGTTFVIFLPLNRKKSKSPKFVIPDSDLQEIKSREVQIQTIPEFGIEPASHDSRTSIDKKDRPYILIVEDNPDMRAYLKDHLDTEYKIITASNGKEGFKTAVNSIPDLIISDIMMPEMDGYTLCKKLKVNDCTDHIPVILLTARAEPEDKIEGLETGADDYLIKPFLAAELLSRIKNLIHQRQKLKEHYIKEILLSPNELN